MRETPLQVDTQRSSTDWLDHRAVREQLERVLSSSPFRNSKRYPAMLRYVVEHTLEGKTHDLKERTVAVEVFGRSPDYDPGTDPVVRISAAEVRRRLAQYYQQPAHGEEIRIELPIGSYVPEFQPAVSAHSVPVPRSRRRPAWLLITGAAAMLIALAVAWMELRPKPSELERFWAPLVAPGGNVLICVGSVGVPARSTDSAAPGGGRSGRIAWSDTLTMARLTGFLEARGLAAQFCREEQATFSDFQLMPAVLIGGLNDEWALRLMENLRFQFRREGSIFWIVDREHPESREWSVEGPTVPENGRLPLKRDFAVISRIHNPRTGKITITVAGLRGTGTVAAGKFLTDPVYLRDAAKKLPADWRNRNLQFVLGAEVIKGNPGPPQVLASVVW